jgi:hypothetical protein
MDTYRTVTLAEALDRLDMNAIARDVSPEVARQARKATARILASSGQEPLSRAQERRAAAYYAAVVRRRAMRRGQPPRGAARLVVAAVVEDLRASGRDGKDIWDQLERGWSDSVPYDVLEEFRLRLCG